MYETSPELNITLPYREGYIMDRNLGARMAAGTTYETQGMAYQYGRKDPFIMLPQYYDGEGKSYNTYNAVLNNKELPTTGDNIIKMTVLASSNALPTMSDLHKSPSTMYATTSTNYPDYVGVRGGGTAPLEKLEHNFTWHDTQLSYATKVSGETVDPWNKFRKSLFDPCPPGWQVMSRDNGSEYTDMALRSEFGYNSHAVPKSNGAQSPRGLYPYGIRGDGLYYWPSVIKAQGQAPANAPVEGIIYFPRSYSLTYNGRLTNITEYPSTLSSFWLGTIGSVQGIGAAFAHSYSSPNLGDWGYLKGNYKAEALQVRCVKSPQTPPKQTME